MSRTAVTMLGCPTSFRDLGPSLWTIDTALEGDNDSTIGPFTVGLFGLLYYVDCDRLNNAPTPKRCPHLNPWVL